MTRQTITYSWRLREIMAACGLHTISDLIPLLTERGITLSASQIYRLVSTRPDRISLIVLGALTDALDCTVEDLCAFRVRAAALPKAINAGPSVVDLNQTIRPKRARIRRTD
jgi:DNA-binding Xre family transcriptional regulator